MAILQIYFALFCAEVCLFAQSDSAKYLWNAGDYRFGDRFFRSDVSDTIFIGNRELLITQAGESETLIVIPRYRISSFEDSGGLIINPKSSALHWKFPKSWETFPGRVAFATMGIAPDEIQIAMHGNSENNRGICLYSLGTINLVMKFPTDQADANNYRIQFIEGFNYGKPNEFNRMPLIISPDRPGYGFGLTKFIQINPNYANMGAPNDSVVIIDILIDTIFGAYGGKGSGYVNFIKGQILDTLKFTIDRSGSYKINGGTEIRKGALETDTAQIGFLVSNSPQFAGTIYVDETKNFRIAHYLPGITPDHGCFLTLQGDDENFIILKGMCKTDSLIVRGSAGYQGYIEYLIYKRNGRTPILNEKSIPIIHTLALKIHPTIIKHNALLLYQIPQKEKINLDLYDVVGRKVASLLEGYFEPGSYSYNFDLSQYSQGIYFLLLKTEKATKSEKLILLK